MGKKSVDEVRGVLAAAKLRGTATELWVWYSPATKECCGFVGWWKRPKATQKVTCPCGCNHTVELDYDCCNSDMSLEDYFKPSDFSVGPGQLKKLVIAAVDP